jgi:hypothetical protein
MKNIFLNFFVFAFSLVTLTGFSQSENNQELLGLPGDNLDLYAVLNLFQESKTIEDFEKSLNSETSGINNLDLNNDDKVDFIKVVTEKDGNNFMFILQDPISQNETQDVAIISVVKNSSGDVSMQIIGDPALYGEGYVIEPVSEPTKGVTANPGYTGDQPVTSVAPTTNVIVVESTPIVRYIYSPVYVPYYPPYYWGYYPPYWRPFTVMAVGIYRHNNWYHHHGYYGGYHGNVNININNNQINHYNNNKRNTSNTVNNNIKNGNFNTAGKGTNRAKPSTGVSTRPSNTSTRPTTKASTRPVTKPTTTAKPSTRPSTSPSTRPATRPSTNHSNYSTGARSRASSSSYSRPASTGTMSRNLGGRRR